MTGLTRQYRTAASQARTAVEKTSGLWAQGAFDLVMTDAPGADAYPITATTFILMYKQPKDATRSHNALAFFRWAFEKGQDQATSLAYVPLPPPLVQQIETYWQAQIH